MQCVRYKLDGDDDKYYYYYYENGATRGHRSASLTDQPATPTSDNLSSLKLMVLIVYRLCTQKTNIRQNELSSKLKYALSYCKQ